VIGQIKIIEIREENRTGHRLIDAVRIRRLRYSGRIPNEVLPRSRFSEELSDRHSYAAAVGLNRQSHVERTNDSAS
jgi:hypothetical protein